MVDGTKYRGRLQNVLLLRISFAAVELVFIGRPLAGSYATTRHGIVTTFLALTGPAATAAAAGDGRS